VKLLVRERKRDSGTQARYLYTTDLSLSEKVEEAWRMRWEIEELQGTSRPWDSSFWRRERLQGIPLGGVPPPPRGSPGPTLSSVGLELRHHVVRHELLGPVLESKTTLATGSAP